MKTKEEIKAALHQLIDGLDDEALLNLLMADIVPYVIAHRSQQPAPPEMIAGNESPSGGHIDQVNASEWENFKYDEKRKSTNN